MKGRRLGDRLRHLRGSAFVGRADALDRFEHLLHDPDARALWLWGPAGIGKSALLERLADVAEGAGLPTVIQSVDRWRSPAELRRDLGELGDDPTVVLLDGVEQSSQVEAWLRERYLPSLPDDARVVLASRHAPGPSWLADPGWRRLMWVHHLDPLTAPEARMFLTRQGWSPASGDQLYARWGGHPRTLAMVAAARDPGEPRMVSTSCARRVRALPESSPADPSVLVEVLRNGSPEAREVIALAAVNRFVGEGHLATEGRRAHLAALDRGGFVEARSFGVALKAAVREPVLAVLRAEAPAWTTEIVARSLEHTARAVEAAQCDELRNAWLDNGVSLVALEEHGRLLPSTRDVYPDEVRPGEPELLATVIARYFGETSASLLTTWLRELGDGACVGRDRAGRLVGFGHFVDPQRIDGSLASADPAVAVARSWLADVGLLGQPVSLCRFFFPVDGAFVVDNPTTAFLMVEMQRRLLLSGARAAVSVQPEWVLEQLAGWGRHPICGRFELDGVRWTVCGRDLREDTPYEVIRSRLRNHGVGSTRLPLRDDFDRAVREALRDFRRGHRLVESPLAAWLGLEGGSARRAHAVRRTLEDAARGFGPRGDDALHTSLIAATYFGEPRKQRAVAAQLAMGFSTYRRHLRVAVDRLSTSLWERLDGRGSLPASPADGPRRAHASNAE